MKQQLVFFLNENYENKNLVNKVFIEKKILTEYEAEMNREKLVMERETACRGQKNDIQAVNLNNKNGYDENVTKIDK